MQEEPKAQTPPAERIIDTPISPQSPPGYLPTPPAQTPSHEPYSTNGYVSPSFAGDSPPTYLPTAPSGQSAPSLPHGPSSINAHPSRNITPSHDHYYETHRGSAPIPVHPDSAPEGNRNHSPPALERVPTHGSSQYLTSVPISSLTRMPAPVDCPLCGRRAMTKVEKQVGNFTHLWSAVSCFTCCLGCVPYMISSLKDVKHTCGSCDGTLALWHRSGGGTDVFAHPLK